MGAVERKCLTGKPHSLQLSGVGTGAQALGTPECAPRRPHAGCVCAGRTLAASPRRRGRIDLWRGRVHAGLPPGAAQVRPKRRQGAKCEGERRGLSAEALDLFCRGAWLAAATEQSAHAQARDLSQARRRRRAAHAGSAGAHKGECVALMSSCLMASHYAQLTRNRTRVLLQDAAVLSDVAVLERAMECAPADVLDPPAARGLDERATEATLVACFDCTQSEVPDGGPPAARRVAERALEAAQVASFEDMVRASDVTLVDFQATWCGPCQLMSKALAVRLLPSLGFLTVGLPVGELAVGCIVCFTLILPALEEAALMSSVAGCAADRE